ncbi:hypothetical protein D9758_011121 [Tetrapyrgos nigripes]|uniref:Uncharacterized protein n=1 Tax=Tetrapyrgos nigripes TaxID=182062 RepID=A0A8H5CJX0_9AGAR|nr:hypothetical protein D9758_011121 [Tetrapyrgos nigripes]
MSTSPSAQSLHHRNLPSLAIPDPISDLSSMRAKGTSASLAISRHGLNALLHHPPDAFGTFGALPYPEWRTKLVLRAQRAGLGELNKAMEWFLFKGDQSHDLGITSSLQGFGAGNSQPPLERSSSLDAEDSNDPDSAENIAIGISTENTGPVVDSPADGDSVRTAGKSANVKVHIPDSESTDSGEESSDTEWLGWMADLHRQAKLLKEQEVKKLHAEEDEDEHLSEYNPQDDHRRYQEKQMLLEPSAVVVVTSPSQSTTTLQLAVRYLTQQSVLRRLWKLRLRFSILTSPSSNESLGRPRGRKQSFGISSVDQPSSTTSPSTTSRLEKIQLWFSYAASAAAKQLKDSKSIAFCIKWIHCWLGTSYERKGPFIWIRDVSCPVYDDEHSFSRTCVVPTQSEHLIPTATTDVDSSRHGSISRSTAPPKALMVPASPGVGSGSGFNIASSPRLPIGSTGSNTVLAEAALQV